MADVSPRFLLTRTANIVTAHVANNSLAVSDLAGLIADVHAALARLGTPVAEPVAALKPAVSVRASVKPGHIICLEDGKVMTMLKRHLMAEHGMTPADYRAKWQLPANYPMVAPDYAEKRRALAVKAGLGRKAPARRRKLGIVTP